MYLTQSTHYGTLSRSNWNLGEEKTSWNLKLTLRTVKVSGMRRIREKFMSSTCGNSDVICKSSNFHQARREGVYLICNPPINSPFPSCCEPHYESEAKCKVFIMKMSFHSFANKTNFHMKSFALFLAFIERVTATRKCPIFETRVLCCRQDKTASDGHSLTAAK